MSASASDIRVRIAGDLADINKSLRDLKKQTRDSGREASRSRRGWNQLGRGIDTVHSKVLRLAGPLATIFGVRAIQRFTAETISSTSALQKAANTAGVTATTVQELRFSLGQLAEVTDKEVDLSLQRFNRRLGLAVDGGGAAQKTFGALGIELVDTAGRVRGTEEVLEETLRALAGIESENVRAARASEVFGEEAGPKLAAALEGGIDALQSGRDRARELGLILGNDLVRGAEDAEDRLREVGLELRTNFARIALEQVDTIETLAGAFSTAADAVADLVENLVNFRGVGAEASASALRRELEQGRELLDSGFIDRLFGIRTIGGRFNFFPTNEEIQAEIDRIERELRSREIQARVTPFAERRRILDGQGGDQGGGGEERVDRRGDIQQLAGDLDAATTLLTDELARAGEALDQEFAANLTRFADYYRERAELERRAIDQEIEQRQAALQLADEEIRIARQKGEDVTKFEQQRASLVSEITVLERQRADAARNAAREQAEAERELAEQLGDVRVRLQELQGDTAGARSAQLEREFSDLIQRLQVEGDAAGEALVRRLIDVELAKTRLQELQSEYQRTLSDLARAEQRVNIEAETGVISQREARRQIIELHRETAAEVEALIPRMRELAEATGDPAAIERVQEMELRVLELGRTAAVVGREMQQTFRDAGEDAFADFLSGASDARDALLDFVSTMRRQISQLISERLFDRLFQTSGGGSGGTGFFAQLASAFLHDGGIAGRDGRVRSVPAIAFAGAPRLHSGGFPGLKSNEVPAVLERGEGVISRRDMQRLGRGGDTIVNVYAQDAQSFRRQSQTQLAAQARTMLERAARRNG